MLTLHKPKTDRKVQWQEGVVDNELMGKKKSKCMLFFCGFYVIKLFTHTHTHTCTCTCTGHTYHFPAHTTHITTVLPAGCCIYTKPHKFGESDSESDGDDDECCHEHRVARRKVPK